MLISEKIAEIIEEMLQESGGACELRRNELAGIIGCVPSQINYVITSRFTKERGYIVESRRGGGGYIRIIRPEISGSTYLCHLLATVGDSIDDKSAIYLINDMYSNGIISEREAKIIASIIGRKELLDDTGRADAFKSVILSVVSK